MLTDSIGSRNDIIHDWISDSNVNDESVDLFWKENKLN